jgi:hypothetical protein
MDHHTSDTDMEVDDLSKTGDNSPPLKFLDVIGRQVMRSDGVYVDGSIQLRSRQQLTRYQGLSYVG